MRRGQRLKISRELENKMEKIYEDLASKTIKLIYEHFPDQFPADFFDVLKAMLLAYLSTLSAQLDRDGLPYSKGKLPPRKMMGITNEIIDHMGEILAKEGIAQAKTTER
jgi:hypothetical protein